jgi:hypothetical protein
LSFNRIDDHICPNCGFHLHFIEQEYDYGDILETVDCGNCKKEFEIQFVPVKITELKDND